MELILEEWFAAREKPKTEDDPMSPPPTTHVRYTDPNNMPYAPNRTEFGKPVVPKKKPGSPKEKGV